MALTQSYCIRCRPIDIQTSDAGPGVSSNEKLVQIRMAEYFQVFNFDLQVRAHYAPNDCQTYIAEQVMRSLNEATGDGRSISLPRVPLFDGMSESQICGLNQDEFNAPEQQCQEEISKLYAENVAKRYQGKRCLETTIHALTTSYNIYDNFFFDDEFEEAAQLSSINAKFLCWEWILCNSAKVCKTALHCVMVQLRESGMAVMMGKICASFTKKY